VLRGDPVPTIAGTGVDSGPFFLRSREQVSDCAATDAALRIDKTCRFTCAAHLQIRYLYEHTGTRPGTRWVGQADARATHIPHARGVGESRDIHAMQQPEHAQPGWFAYC
jgi:hypothetical protein